jgi:hypothetical protein
MQQPRIKTEKAKKEKPSIKNAMYHNERENTEKRKQRNTRG